MQTEFTGTVVGGGLKLDRQINLPDNSRVTVAVEPLDEPPNQLKSGLDAWRKFCNDQPTNSGGRHYTREELHERC
jgi:hypothetical protein